MHKQTAKLIARIAENLPDMQAAVMQVWIDTPQRLQKFLRNLNPLSGFEVRIEPASFLQGGSEIWVSDNFRSQVLDKLVTEVKHIDLRRQTNDTEAFKILGGRRIFSEEHLTRFISEMIVAQPAGGEGKLQNNGHCNVFYTDSSVASVYYAHGNSLWVVDAWSRRDALMQWQVGDRVFYPEA